MQKIGFLGPPGTFSQQAALIYTRNNPSELISFPTIAEALIAVQQRQLDAAVVPMENSLEGSVNVTLDLLAWEVDLAITAELILPISHNLLITPGAKWREVKQVFTHPQAAGQCRKFLARELPGAEIHLTYSTAEGAQLAKAAGSFTAAIAPHQAADIFELEAARQDIQDSSDNYTRFIVAGAGETSPSGSDKTSIVFSTKHRPGSLYRVLDIFNIWDINMNRIESRPARGKLGEYIFFVDLDGHAQEPELADALTMVRRKTTFFKFLGSYRRGNGA